jgi:hypothetical protein
MNATPFSAKRATSRWPEDRGRSGMDMAALPAAVAERGFSPLSPIGLLLPAALGGSRYGQTAA